MGGQLSLLTPTASTIAIDAYVNELGDVQYERLMSNARFLKTIKGTHLDGLVVCKVFIKPSDIDLVKVEKELIRKCILLLLWFLFCFANSGQRRSLARSCNSAPYARVANTERAGYLVRQYFRYNLYDRISSRPFLEHIEKLWITYQLLHALKDSHEVDVCHGDIKSENIMVTSWNWIYLSDYAPYKPVYLPENDPSYFSFFFDTSQRRTCYLAPERFNGSTDSIVADSKELTPQMDIFSLGCVIAELFQEGAPTFTLAELYKYKRGEFEPSLASVEDPAVRSLVLSMIDIDPAKRLSAADYIEKWTGSAFPSYFPFLHSYIANLSRPIDQSVDIERAKQIESDSRIIGIWEQFHTISMELGYDPVSDSTTSSGSNSTNNKLTNLHHCDPMDSVVPVCLDLPQMDPWVPKHRQLTPTDDGALMIVALVCSSIRNTSNADTRVKACELLLALGERVHDEAKLDRCIPHLISILDDSSDIVCIAALRSLTHLLDLVGAITPVNGNIFLEYIFPKLSTLLNSYSDTVRCAYASCLATLAQVASKFLDMGQVLKSTGMMETVDPETENGVSVDTSAFDTLRQNLSFVIEEHVTALLTDSSSFVRRSLLRNLVPLCMFFGKQKTNDVILSHLITYLNDKDPFLRIDLFDSVVALAPYVGAMSLEQYIIPLMIQTLADPEEFVVNKVICAFTDLSDLGLIRPPLIWELLKTCSKFIIHPNTWIRNSIFAFISSTTRWMTAAQLYCLLHPIIRPFLTCDICDFTEPSLMTNAAPQMSRAVYNRALSWASNAQKSLFWKIQEKPSSSTQIPKYGRKSSSSISLSSEDEQWIKRLTEVGLKKDDMWMLVTFKEYIFRIARVNSRPGNDRGLQLPSTVEIQSVGVLPHNVFFDNPNPSHGKSSHLSRATIHESNELTGTTSPMQNNRQTSSMGDGTSLLSGGGSTATATARALPSTATDLTDAYGEVTSESGRVSSPANFVPDKSPENTLKAISSYTGDDPYVWTYLRSVANSSMGFPDVDSDTSKSRVDFGPRFEPCTKARTKAPNSTLALRNRKGKPLGIMVSSFDEHNGAVNALAVSPDHRFFVSGSDDGTVKVWDCFRLEKNVINKSVQTLRLGDNVQVKSICFIGNTYSFACATSDGKINLVQVEATPRTESLGPRYRKISVIHRFDLQEGEIGLNVQYVKTELAGSCLYVSTSRCRIAIIDLERMESIQELKNQYSHGIITSFVVDRKKNWLLMGTSLGVLDLWDLRFQVPVKSWALSGGKPIRQLSLYPKDSDKLVCVVGGTDFPEVTVWDIENAECREIYRASDSTDTGKRYRAVQSLDRLPMPEEIPEFQVEGSSELLCAVTGVHELDGGKQGFIIAGGMDRCVRFWDVSRPEVSGVVSGLKHDSGKTAYSVLNPQANLKLVTEMVIPAKSGRSKSERIPRTTAIAAEQLDAGRNHQADVITVATLLRPYELLISADRTGVIKIFM